MAQEKEIAELAAAQDIQVVRYNVRGKFGYKDLHLQVDITKQSIIQKLLETDAATAGAPAKKTVQRAVEQEK